MSAVVAVLVLAIGGAFLLIAGAYVLAGTGVALLVAGAISLFAAMALAWAVGKSGIAPNG